MTEPVAPLTGGCMCGAVRFEVSEPLLGVLYCHCKRCQRRTGSAFSISGLTQPGSFTLIEGDDVRAYEPGDRGWLKSYCGRCGSQLFTTNPESPELIAVRVEALDQDPGVPPSLHQFVDYTPPWAPVPDDGPAALPRAHELGVAPAVRRPL
jgi:hypothetical protein